MLDGDVGVADAGSGDLHDDFVGCGRLKVDIPECERPAHPLNNRGRDLHPLPLFCSAAFGSDAVLAALPMEPTTVEVDCADPDEASVVE